MNPLSKDTAYNYYNPDFLLDHISHMYLAFNNSPVLLLYHALKRDTIYRQKWMIEFSLIKIYISAIQSQVKSLLKPQKLPKKIERRKKLRKINEKRKNKLRFLRNCFRRRKRFIFSKHKFMVMKRAYPVVYQSHKPLSFSTLDTTLREQKKIHFFTTAQKFQHFSSRVKFFAQKRDYSVIFSRFKRLYTMVKKKNRNRYRTFVRAAYGSILLAKAERKARKKK